MATANQVLGLLKSHVRGDDEQLYAIALQIAAAEARRGRASRAEELRELVDQGRTRSEDTVRPVGLSSGSVHSVSRAAHSALESLALVTEPRTRFSDMVLAEPIRNRLEQMLREQRQRARLREYGQRPDARLLLVGPPGCGKTMSANAIAGELGLALVTVRLDTLITRYLGETATHLRRVFDEVADRRAVYLFDEFDALGNSRDDSRDVGEMRRVLNSFLQFLEEPNSTDSPIVATTNRPDALDAALLRRFDGVVRYTLPTPEAAQELLSHHLGQFAPRALRRSLALDDLEALSQAEIALAAREAIKKAILSERDKADLNVLREALRARRAMQAELGDESRAARSR